MRTPAIIAILLAAATSASVAQPLREEGGGRVPWGHRERHRPPRSDHEWVMLASPTPTRFGTEFIPIGREAGVFRSLRIDLTAGTVFLRRIRVTFSDGYVRMYRIERWLDPRHPTTYIDLGTRRFVDQIAVTTSRAPAGSYAVFGSSGPPIPPRGLVVGSLETPD